MIRSAAYNVVYTAHFIRPNSAYGGGTSYSPKTLDTINLKEILLILLNS